MFTRHHTKRRTTTTTTTASPAPPRRQSLLRVTDFSARNLAELEDQTRVPLHPRTPAEIDAAARAAALRAMVVDVLSDVTDDEAYAAPGRFARLWLCLDPASRRTVAAAWGPGRNHELVALTSQHVHLRAQPA